MLSIQQAGTEILGNAPRKLYFFCGSEYGVKEKYLRHLQTMYGSVEQVDSMFELFKSLKRKSLLASKPCVYVCRYDSEFVKRLSKETSSDVRESLVNGCVIALYEDEKAFSKLNKFFPNNVVRFDAVSSEFVAKYLKSDFPELDDRFIKLLVSKTSCSYGHLRVACSQILHAQQHMQESSDEDVLFCLGLNQGLTEDRMMKYAAARNVTGVLRVADSFEGDPQHLINGLCHVSIELDKAMDSRSSSNYSKYVKSWTRPDVYNFFEQCYCATLKLRSEASSSSMDCLVFLASLLKFKPIPSVEQISCF